MREIEETSRKMDANLKKKDESRRESGWNSQAKGWKKNKPGQGKHTQPLDDDDQSDVLPHLDSPGLHRLQLHQSEWTVTQSLNQTHAQCQTGMERWRLRYTEKLWKWSKTASSPGLDARSSRLSFQNCGHWSSVGVSRCVRFREPKVPEAWECHMAQADKCRTCRAESTGQVRHNNLTLSLSEGSSFLRDYF